MHPFRLGLVPVLVLAAHLPAAAQEVTIGDALPSTTPDLSRFLPRDDFDRDGRRTLGAFPRNLGRSFAGVFSRDSLVPLAIGVAASSSALGFDRRAGQLIGGTAGAFGKAGAKMGGLQVVAPLTLSLLAGSRLTHDGRFRAFTYDAAQAILVSTVYTDVLKRVSSRTRPDGSNTLSFPSGHTSTAFAWATVAKKHYGWKGGVPAFLAASAIGVSRIEQGRHNLSDVLAGATLGVIVGRTVVRENGEPIGRQRAFSLTPMSDARGTGVGVGASVSW